MSKLSLITTPKIRRNEMSGIKALVGKRTPKEVTFMGSKISIFKLSVKDVMEIQTMARESEKDADKESGGFDVLKKIIALGVDGGDQLTEEDFISLPMDDLNSLSTAVMQYSGIDAKNAGK